MKRQFAKCAHFLFPKARVVLLVAFSSSCLVVVGDIYDATKNGDVLMVKALLKGTPDLAFKKNADGLTPLHIASTQGNKAIAELLIACKANVNATNNYSLTPLICAAWGGIET
jgi:hypothetical protein